MLRLPIKSSHNHNLHLPTRTLAYNPQRLNHSESQRIIANDRRGDRLTTTPQPPTQSNRPTDPQRLLVVTDLLYSDGPTATDHSNRPTDPPRLLMTDLQRLDVIICLPTIKPSHNHNLHLPTRTDTRAYNPRQPNHSKS